MPKIFLASGENFRVLDNANIIGKAGSSETVRIMGTPSVTMDANIDRVEFTGNINQYTFEVSGTSVTIRSGGSAVATFGGVENIITLAFADGSAPLELKGLSSALLGTVSLSTLSGGSALTPSLNTSDKSTVGDYTPADSSISISVTSGNTTPYDASSDDVAFNFTNGNYIYNISGFSNGDILNTLDTAAITVSNSSAADGIIDILVADSAGGTNMTIHLTGVTTAQDGAAFSQSSFINVFGPGSLG
ncbi:MAG: hypothetical protein HQK71_04625 [Desulfamplus sp.]|nr:hypothetical protein [Desulfamplus sp.]